MHWPKLPSLFYPADFFLLVLFLSVLAVSAATPMLADGGAIDCDHFQVLELRDICTANSNPVFVHDNISSTALNQKVDSWGSSPGLHFLPPKVYVLSRSVKLHKGQRILPNPDTPLSEGKQLRTVALEADTNFSIGGDPYFSLLQTASDNAVGGVEIDGSKLNDSIQGYRQAGEKHYPRTLIYAPNSVKVVIAGSVLTGMESLDHLIWNPFLDDFYWDICGDLRQRDDEPGLRLRRNFLKADGMTSGLLVTGGYHPPVIENNAIFVRTPSEGGNISSGIRIEKGAALFQKNDIVYSGESSSQSRRTAIDVDAPEALSLLLNAFYVMNAEVLTESDRGISVSSHSHWLRVSGNRFPEGGQFLVAEEGGESKPNVIESDNYAMAYRGPYRLSTPLKFFAFTGDLGVTQISAGLLANELGGYNVTALQNADSTSDESIRSNLTGLVDRADYCLDCPTYTNRYDAIGIPVTIVAFVLTQVCCCGLMCWTCGARHWPYL
ncbi:MAG: hypothetical protein ACR2PT_05120 [Endozoicomonas sp.]